MVFYYHFGYNDEDEFFAIVDDGSKSGPVIFSIDTTEEVMEYIETGRMKHIDDIEGLEQFIKEMTFLQSHDTLEMGELLV